MHLEAETMLGRRHNGDCIAGVITCTLRAVRLCREFSVNLNYAYFDLAVRLKEPFSRDRRQARMDLFVRTMGLRGCERIIDLGGVGAFWNECPVPLELTIVNLPGSGLKTEVDPRHRVKFVECDACNPVLRGGQCLRHRLFEQRHRTCRTTG